MWLIAEYRPAALFSLKTSLATSTGAKTLLVPTPFAVRTALLDAAIRCYGLEFGRRAFDQLKALRIALRPPERVVVTNLFTKVQKPRRGDREESDDEEATPGAMQKSIAFREYAYLDGIVGLAFGEDEGYLAELRDLLSQVNYFGKRGSFFQLCRPPEPQEQLPAGYYLLDGVYLDGGGKIRGQGPSSFPLGLIQVLDDWGPDLTFEKVNIYSRASITLGKDRVQKTVILPYRLIRSSKSFSLYERLDVRIQEE